MKILCALTLSFIMILSCKQTPEQQYRYKMQTASEEELLSEVFKKSNVYRLVFKDKITDDIADYTFNYGLFSEIGDGATIQVLLNDESSIYVDSKRFEGSFKSGYYSSDNGRYQVTILSDEDFETNPTIIKKVFSINGVKYNQHKDNAGVSRHLNGVKLHPGLKSNVVVVKDMKGFINSYNLQLYKPFTVVFKNLTPVGYYDGPLDKR